jgi:Bacterial inner membrane protein
MQRMLAVLAANPAADGAGLVAMLCFIAWPLFQARWMMLVAYIGNNLCFALHYALLGHWTAVAMNGLMSVQTVVAIMLVRQPRLRWAYYALMPMLALASVVTWQGVPSFLAAAATTLSTIGRMQTNDVILRVLLLAERLQVLRPTAHCGPRTCRAHHQTPSSNQDPSLDPNSKELNRIRWDQTEPARGGKACKTCSIALDDTCCDEPRRLSRPVLARRLSWGSERLDSDRGQFIYGVFIYDVCNSMIVF